MRQNIVTIAATATSLPTSLWKRSPANQRETRLRSRPVIKNALGRVHGFNRVTEEIIYPTEPEHRVAFCMAWSKIRSRGRTSRYRISSIRTSVDSSVFAVTLTEMVVDVARSTEEQSRPLAPLSFDIEKIAQRIQKANLRASLFIVERGASPGLPITAVPRMILPLVIQPDIDSAPVNSLS